jgi:hypothetical protein
MKRTWKITLTVLGIILAVGIALFIGADVIVSRIAKKEVNKALANLPGCEASCGDIHVRLFSGIASVSDLRFSYRGETVIRKDTVRPGVTIEVERIDVGRVFYSLLLRKKALVHSLTVVRPQVELWMDEKHPELCFPQLPQDTTPKTFPLAKAELMTLAIQNASLALHSVRTKLDVAADSCSLEVHDLAYDTAFSYCDSVYLFYLAHAAVTTPDGRIRIDTRDLAHANQGSLYVGTTRIANTMPKMKLGDIVREPVTWIDMTIASVSTSPFNPVRKALAKDMSLESAEAVVAQMNVFRDTRYKPKTPYQTPQQALMAIPVTFNVKHVDAAIEHLFIELASTEKNIGHLSLQDIHAKVDNVTNRRGATLRLEGGCPVDKGGATAKATLTMDRESTFYSRMHVTDVNVSFLSPFIRPLVGMTADCMIDTLDTEYTGNTTEAKGSFRMLYKGLEIMVHKDDDIPYKIITRNANTFTALGNALIPKSNPTAVDIRPRAYEVCWKYDPWQPWPLYLFGPCIDGVKKTFLPGLYVHTQINKTFKN